MQDILKNSSNDPKRKIKNKKKSPSLGKKVKEYL